MCKSQSGLMPWQQVVCDVGWISEISKMMGYVDKIWNWISLFPKGGI